MNIYYKIPNINYKISSTGEIINIQTIPRLINYFSLTEQYNIIDAHIWIKDEVFVKDKISPYYIDYKCSVCEARIMQDISGENSYEFDLETCEEVMLKNIIE